jgi:hypothetical protein
LWQRTRGLEGLGWYFHRTLVDLPAKHALDARRGETTWVMVPCCIGTSNRLHAGRAKNAPRRHIRSTSLAENRRRHCTGTAASMQEATRLRRIAEEAKGSMPTIAKIRLQKRRSSDGEGVRYTTSVPQSLQQPMQDWSRRRVGTCTQGPSLKERRHRENEVR